MKRKILLVEDEVLLAMAKQQELARYNYETSYVTTGEKAVDLICRGDEPIDLILMDIDLGRGIDGTEAARQILEHKEVPIVFLSSHEEPEIVEKTEKITSYGYVVKSSSITVLDASIKMAFKLYDTKMNLTIHQKTLEQNEKDLKASQHIARLGSWRLDVASNAVTWTEELYKMYGFDPSLPPPPFTEHMKLFSSESWERLSAALEETVKTGKPYTLELEMSKERKSIGWMWVRGEAVQDEAGEIVELWGAAQDITEKKKMEEALRWKEDLLNKTGELARVGGWEADLDTNKVFWTQATKLIHEVPMDYEPLLEEALSFFPGESGQRLTMAFNRAVAEGGGYDLELDFITAKDKYLKVRTIANTEYNNGRCKRIYGTFQDITEMKNIEQKLKESEEKYKRAQAAAHVGSWEYDIKTNSFWGSEEGKRIYGFDIGKDEFIAEEVMKCVIERERVEQAMTDLVEHNIPYDIVFTISPRNSKEIKTIHSISVLEKDEDGNPSKVIGTLHDITALKRMEKEVQESEEKFKAYVENANDLIFNVTLDGNFTYVSPNWTNMLGHDVEEVIGQSFIPYVHPDDVYKNNAIFEKVITTGEKQSHIEYRVKHKHGHYVWHASTGAPIKDNAGNVVSFVGIARDITERKKAEEELQQALKDKDFLMKELNHRVKNSLLMVSSLVSLKGSETEINLSDIQHQIESISLIHEKLYQSESVAKINSMDYFGDLLDSIFSSFTKRRVRIDRSIEDISLPIETAMPLGLIINEIATNAIKHGFTDNEDAVFSMTMEKNKKNTQYELNLSNTGNPFPEDVDIESTRTLGLRLINALVAQLDGTVELQRKPNPMFTINFPMEIE